jgi:hypothetical protein
MCFLTQSKAVFEYNFSFHVSKKDQCALCINYYRNKDQDTLTMEIKDEYEKHQSRITGNMSTSQIVNG